MVTPPIGLNCFIVARYANQPLGDVFRGVTPHIIAHIVALAILVIPPQITLWLPSLMK
jgi:TRAP-type C4-dicarboxylate transport system permease large subunit